MVIFMCLTIYLFVDMGRSMEFTCAVCVYDHPRKPCNSGYGCNNTHIHILTLEYSCRVAAMALGAGTWL